jgi:hypothetical protein
MADTRLHNFHRRNCWVWPLVLADRLLLHGPRRTIWPAASGVRLDFERVVPWRPHDAKVDCRWAARDLRRRHYTNKTGRSTNLNLEVAAWRLPSLARLRHRTASSNVRVRGGSRKYMLALSSSGFDPSGLTARVVRPL